MARIFGGNQDQANTNRIVGTYGYIAPEYAMHGRFSEKSDVYTMGVLIYNFNALATYRKKRQKKEKIMKFLTIIFSMFVNAFVLQAWTFWTEKNIVKLIDTKIFDPCFQKELVRCVQIGLLCVQEYAEDRPNVSTILSMLTSEIAELPNPKQPAFTGGHGSSEQGSSKSKGSVNADSITAVEPR